MTKLNDDEKYINKKVKVYFDKKESKKVIDPYTVVIGTSVFDCSADAGSPNGIAMYVGELEDFDENGWDKSEFNKKNLLNWNDVPDGIKKFIIRLLKNDKNE